MVYAWHLNFKKMCIHLLFHPSPLPHLTSLDNIIRIYPLKSATDYLKVDQVWRRFQADGSSDSVAFLSVSMTKDG